MLKCMPCFVAGHAYCRNGVHIAYRFGKAKDALSRIIMVGEASSDSLNIYIGKPVGIENLSRRLGTRQISVVSDS